MTAFAGAAAAYVQNPPGKPWQSMPALTVSWDGAATPTLTVTETGDGSTAAKFSGQALIQDSVPAAVLSAAAATGQNPREALLT